MVQTSAKGMENVRSVNAEQGCSHTELRIVSDSNQFLAIFKAWRELFVCFMNKCWPIQASSKFHRPPALIENPAILVEAMRPIWGHK